jgi:hypothetical protein
LERVSKDVAEAWPPPPFETGAKCALLRTRADNRRPHHPDPGRTMLASVISTTPSTSLRNSLRSVFLADGDGSRFQLNSPKARTISDTPLAIRRV